jgi:hypothetical protein
MGKRLQVNIRADEWLLQMLADLKPISGTDRATIEDAVGDLWTLHFGGALFDGLYSEEEHHEDGDDGRLD